MLYVLLAGKFPFFREGDEKLGPRSRLQQILPRVVTADFELPPHASPDCQALLKMMLTCEPAQRATLQQVQQAPWFQKNLPPGALALNAKLVDQPLNPELQSEQEIMAILTECQQPALQCQPPPLG